MGCHHWHQRETLVWTVRDVKTIIVRPVYSRNCSVNSTLLYRSSDKSNTRCSPAAPAFCRRRSLLLSRPRVSITVVQSVDTPPYAGPFVRKLRQLQLDDGLTDEEFANQFGMAASAWNLVRRGARRAGRKIIEGAFSVYPSHHAELAQALATVARSQAYEDEEDAAPVAVAAR